MSEPMLTVIDGCPGLSKAVDEVFPESDKQRCTKHKTENAGQTTGTGQGIGERVSVGRYSTPQPMSMQRKP